MNGNEDEENYENSDKQVNNKNQTTGDVLFDLKRKFDNLWYHYKFALLALAAFLAIIIYAVVQCAAQPQGDVNIAYIGAKSFESEVYNELQNDLDRILGEDLNGDKKIYVKFTNFLYMTDTQIEDSRASGNVVDINSLMTVQTQISLELIDGNIIIYFLDPAAYKQYKKINGIDMFMPLEDALGYVPAKSYDEFSLRVKDLYCWDYFAGIYNFPEDTLVAVRERQVSDDSRKDTDEKYERNLLMFKRLVEFKGLNDTNGNENDG